MNMFLDQLTEAPPVTDQPKSGFADNLQARIGLDASMFLATSGMDLGIVDLRSETEKARQASLMKYREEGLINEDTWAFYKLDQLVGADWEGAADFANKELGLTDILTREDYQKEVAKEYAGYMAMTEEVTKNQGILGFLGDVAGSVVASSLDPLTWPGYFVGGAGASLGLKAAARQLAKGMAVEALMQVPRQYRVNDFHTNYIGIERSSGQAVAEAALSVLSVGVFSAGGYAAGKIFNKFAPEKVKDMFGRGPAGLTSQEVSDILEAAKEAGDPTVHSMARTAQKFDPGSNFVDELTELENRHTAHVSNTPVNTEAAEETIEEAAEDAAEEYISPALRSTPREEVVGTEQTATTPTQSKKDKRRAERKKKRDAKKGKGQRVVGTEQTTAAAAAPDGSPTEIQLTPAEAAVVDSPRTDISDYQDSIMKDARDQQALMDLCMGGT